MYIYFILKKKNDQFNWRNKMYNIRFIVTRGNVYILRMGVL